MIIVFRIWRSLCKEIRVDWNWDKFQTERVNKCIFGIFELAQKVNFIVFGNMNLKKQFVLVIVRFSIEWERKEKLETKINWSLLMQMNTMSLRKSFID